MQTSCTEWNSHFFVKLVEGKTTSFQFKCLDWFNKQAHYQDALRLARDRLEKGLSVPVRILKEDDNPVDADPPL